MDDLISRDEVKGRLLDYTDSVDDTKTLSMVVGRIVENIQGVDAVPVVRCRDCKYCFSTDNDPLTPYNGETDWYCEEFDVDWHVLTLDPNRFYCANGERREE